MDLPAEKWKAYARRRWASLEPGLREQLSLAVPPRDTFLLCLPLFQAADEEFLRRLALRNGVGKDPRAALFYKQEGNKRFQEREYAAARVLYSKAVSHNSPEMSLCYANRSAALFHLGQFEDCLEDIDRAQAQGYPDRLQPKILLRKTECLLLLGRLQEAAGVISKVESKIAMDQSLTSTTRQILLRKISQLKVKAHEKESSPLSVPEALSKTQKDLEFWEENGKISSASSSVSLNFNSCKGRHLVATKDILPGENLVKEEAFVSVLSPGKGLLLQDSAETTWDTRVTNGDLHCHRCLKQLLASVPCGGCSYAKYCSKKCAQLAWEHYHSTECPLGALLLTLGVFSHVALRTVLVAGFAEVSSLVKQFHGDDKELYKAEARGKSLDETRDSTAGMEGLSEKPKPLIPGCEDDGQYQGSYQAVFNLLTHAEKHSPEHKFLCSLSIIAICKKLLNTDLTIFSQESCESQSKLKAHVKLSAELSPELKILGEAMLRHMLQLQCNAQAVTAIRESDQAVELLMRCRMDAENFLSAEHMLVGEIEDHLAQGYATLGKWQEAAKHLQRSIQIVETRHGPSSVETGHELFKLAQVLFNGFAVSEALCTIQRAETVLSVHCGPQNAQVQELQEMRACLLELPRNLLHRVE
ncbi:SET and MYND domain-containing protein 4 isoform X5 [Lepidochelys kempii]|uniref:SET and MYND domain-containing protein 4 isoform X5 n=1 Tax=Lepidochelys kempii TaxID=8472 RepID=UPI003C6EB161